MLEESPGTQLVSRHCFILEEQPNDATSPVPKSAIDANGDMEALKEDEQLPSSNGSTDLKNKIINNQRNANSGQSEMKQSASSKDSPQKSSGKELSDSFVPVDVTSGSGEPDNKSLPEELTSQSDRKDASNFDEAMTNKTSDSKELGDVPIRDGDAPSMLKFVDDQKLSEEGKPESVEQSCNSELIDQVQQISE